MVLRRDAAGVLAVGQASHAWLCGQLARAWGNERFGAVQPLAEVALGAEQHDVGMGRWDLAPARNPQTGLPQSFMEMGAAANAGLWLHGPRRLVSQSRYAALLAIMHGRRLYERVDVDLAPGPEAAAVTAFLEHARELEATLLAALRADPFTADYATSALVARNSQLVWTWDTISLALLLDWAPLTLEAVPTAAGGAVDVTMVALPTDPPVASLDPWPFTANEVRLHCEGRRLTQGCDDDDALARALDQAPWETVQFTVVAGADLRPGP
ncbi:MAG: DUF3891 family protein [Solirubrobacteraceae bacterium]